MKKWLLAGSIVVLLATAGYLGRGIFVAAPATSTPTPAPVDLQTPLIADARVLPIRSAALSLPIDGTVAAVLVREGQQVQAGQILVQLDQSHQQARLKNARAALAEAQASYERLLAGATEADRAIAEAQLRQAESQARNVASSVTPQDISAAQAQIAQAQAALRRLERGPDEHDRRTAAAQLAQAQHNLTLQRDQLSAAKTNAELQLRQAANSLVQAQTAYSTARWNWEEVERTGRDPLNPTMPNPANPQQSSDNKLNDAQKQRYYDAFVTAEAALQSAEQAVEQARIGHTAAQQAEIDGIRTAELQLEQAQLAYDHLLHGADADAWAAARAQLAAGQAALARLSGDQRSSSIETANAAIEVAQASLARLEAPPPESELALARTRVQVAQAELDQATLALADTELHAPFAGSVAEIVIEQNEYVVPGMAVVRLADFSAWKIETIDLTELNIAGVQVGAPVTITFDALPSLEMSGTLTRIAPYGEIRQGDITYTATITPAEHNPMLYWNMTATVAIMAP